ncbi:MAG: hypothetical protein AAFX85_18210 [Pseudomonadota bacterium]
MRLIVCALAVLGLSACASTGTDGWEPAAEANEPAETSEGEAIQVADSSGDPDRVICQRVAITGTKFKKKICGTQEQWDQSRAQGREAAEGVHRSVKAQTAFDN